MAIHKTLLFVTVLAVLVAATGATVGLAAGGQSELSTQMEQFHKAVSAQNAKEIEALLADDYVLITRNGSTNTKSQFLDRMKRGVTPHAEKYEAMGTRIYGNTGVVTEKETLRTEHSMQAISTSVWIKDQGRWKLVLRQNTSLP